MLQNNPFATTFDMARSCTIAGESRSSECAKKSSDPATNPTQRTSARLDADRFVLHVMSEAVLICMGMYSRHFFLLLRRRFHRGVIPAASAFGSTG
jgi:hypothetical protein